VGKAQDGCAAGKSMDGTIPSYSAILHFGGDKTFILLSNLLDLTINYVYEEPKAQME
jgi:hypothetical protein